MINVNKWNSIASKIMSTPGMLKTFDSGVVIEEGSVRDTAHTRLRFNSNAAVNDDANGIQFTKFMRENGAYVDVRSRRAVTVKSEDLERLFS